MASGLTRREVVQELDEELPLKDLVADLEDRPEPVGQVRTLVVRGVVGMHLDRAVHEFADPPGQGPRRQLAPLAQQQDRPAQARDQKGLNQDNGRRHQAEPKALGHDALVDDPFRQIEGKEIERQRDRHREHDQQLLALAVAPHILEKIGFHPP